MDSTGLLTNVLLVAASLACVAVVWLCVVAVGALKSLHRTSDELRTGLVPLVEKIDITVDAANAELLRIDAAITQLESATSHVSAVSSTISEVVHAPGEVVNNLADRMRRAWRNRGQSGTHHAGVEEQEV